MIEINYSKKEFINFLANQFPDLKKNVLELYISENLISPFKMKQPMFLFNKIQTEIESYENLKKTSYDKLTSSNNSILKKNVLLKNVCTSYDFHINENNELKLIEINTNAAFLALGVMLNEFLNIQTPNNFNSENIVEMFKNEIKLENLNPKRIYILDSKPEQQRLFIEFLIYKYLFIKNDLDATIVDISEISKIKESSLVYNRYTDFYLELNESSHLKNNYLNNQFQLSPSPKEYFLIADKQRMLDWQKQNLIPIPNSLLKIDRLTSENAENIWKNRKNLFFKPSNSFGSKQVYKGASISRRVFDEAIQNQLLAQEVCPAPEIEFKLNDKIEKFKYDIRCFVYDGKLQFCIARMFQGQTTNLQTYGGGFTPIEWV